MKNVSFAMLLAAAVALTGESSVVYRGRLVNVDDPRAVCPFEPGATKAMTFKVYGVAPNGGTGWLFDIMRDVPIETNGLFTVILDHPDLQAAVTNGTATEIGLQIGNAREIKPRRKLLPTPRTATAACAAGLARNATVGSLAAGVVTSQNFRVNGDLSIGKGIHAADGKPVKRLSYRISPSADNLVKVKPSAGGMVSVFGNAMELTAEYGFEHGGAEEKWYQAGETITTAPEDGVATITCSDSIPFDNYRYSQGGSPCCSTVVFCKKGDAIKVPSKWRCGMNGAFEKRHFAVRFHPFIKR